MALIGSLADLNVLELLRMPASGGKTGELLIASPDSDARLYYVDGELVHLAMENLKGQDVLVEVIGWSEGIFEFRPNVLTSLSTFETEFKRAIAMALKERMEQAGPGNLSSADADDVAPTKERLQECIDGNDFVRHISVMRLDGSLMCSINAGQDEPDDVSEQRLAIADLAQTYPRQSLQRILLADEDNTVAASFIGGGCTVMIVADRSGRLGAVSLCLDRLVRKLSAILEK